MLLLFHHFATKEGEEEGEGRRRRRGEEEGEGGGGGGGGGRRRREEEEGDEEEVVVVVWPGMIGCVCRSYHFLQCKACSSQGRKAPCNHGYRSVWLASLFDMIAGANFYVCHTVWSGRCMCGCNFVCGVHVCVCERLCFYQLFHSLFLCLASTTFDMLHPSSSMVMAVL